MEGPLLLESLGEGILCGSTHMASRQDLMASCDLCGHKGHALHMFTRDGHVFCSPQHAFSWTRRLTVPSQGGSEGLLVALADIAVDHIASRLQLRIPNGRKTPPVVPTRSLDTQEYATFVAEFAQNHLFMSEASAERIRSLIEDKLKEYTESNNNVAAVVGPLSAEERLRYSTTFLVRGPADYFLVKIAGVPKLLLIVTLDKNTPIIVVKI